MAHNKYLPDASRPNNPGINGTIVTLDTKWFQWLDSFLAKYGQKTILRKVARKLPRIGAINIVDSGKLKALITISPSSNEGQYRIDQFKGDDQNSNISVQLIISQKEGFKFSNKTPCSANDLAQIANFVTGIFVYEFLMKLDPSVKTDSIEPLEFAGKTIE